jgi:hypothetical protein
MTPGATAIKLAGPSHHRVGGCRRAVLATEPRWPATVLPVSGLEAAIEQALKNLSPGHFQRLAEGYAELRWPARYRHLVPQGRNPFDATTTGWPDAWSRSLDGEIHAVEATMANGWSTHLMSDIDKAKQHAGLASFVFVSTANPRDTSVVPHRKALHDLGLINGHIDLVFRKQLVRDLAEPRFARLRAAILRLPPTPSPFVAIEHARNLYGDGTTMGFAPTSREYAKRNGVWRNKATPAVLRKLRHDSWAYIEGRGAAGKTVLCAQIALRWAGGLGAAYYLDLAEGTAADPTTVIDAMVTYGGPDVLFVVDNVHAAERVAGGVFDNWCQRGDGSALLLSGRHVSADPWAGVGDPLRDLRSAAIVVRATSEDLFGTYGRLAARVTSRPTPPTRYLTRRWAQLFRGDLVAFAVALSGKLDADLLFSDLSPEDAVEYVRSEYLRPYPGDDARAALTTVAALGALEISTPPGLVDASLLEPSLATGAVLRTDGALTLAHAGLGRLLLAAQRRPTVDVETLANASHTEPALAPIVARRLAARASRRDYLAFWQAAVRIGEWTALLPDSLADLPDVVQAVRAASGVSWPEVDDAVVDAIDWVSAAPRTSPGQLPAVIGLCGARLPRSSRALGQALFPDGDVAPWLRDALASSGGATRLALRGLVAQFHPDIASAFAPLAFPEPIDAIVEDIGELGMTADVERRLERTMAHGSSVRTDLDARLAELGAERWAEVIATAPPRAVRRLLRALPATASTIDDALTRPRLPEAWIDGQTGQLPKRIADLRSAMPALHHHVVAHFVQEGDAELWATRMLTRGVEHLGTNRQVAREFGIALGLAAALGPEGRPFVDRVDAELAANKHRELLVQAVRVQTTYAFGYMLGASRVGWERLDAALRELATDEILVRDLARELCNADLSDVELVLIEHPLADAVVSAVRPDLWRAGRGVLEVSAAQRSFPVVTAGLIAHSRADLAQAVAEHFAAAIIDGLIPADRVGMAHAASLFALLPRASHRLRTDVAVTLGTPEWATHAAPNDRYELANRLYDLAIWAPELTARLDGMRFGDRLAGLGDPSTRSGLLRLLGSASLIGPDAPQHRPPELAADDVRAILHRAAWCGPDVPNALAQALMGAKVLAATGMAVGLSSERARQLMGQCDATRPRSPQHEQVLRAIRAWAASFAE